MPQSVFYGTNGQCLDAMRFLLRKAENIARATVATLLLMAGIEVQKAEGKGWG